LLRFSFALLLALLPSLLKIPLYRVFYHYRIGKNVRIGFSPFVGIKSCEIGEGVRIGHLNLFYRAERLELGAHTHIGFLNLIRGGTRVKLGSYVTVLRQNTFNSILDRDFVEPADATLELGDGVFIAAGHWLDFSHRILIGAHSILGGRNSSIWTHNRQRARPIEIGAHTYLGSEIRVAPGVKIPPFSIVSLGSVLTGEIESARVLIGGNPANIIRPLNVQDLFLVLRKTRNDIPDAVANANLPPDLQNLCVASPES
jgi:acetyltransferase-like isoleucine patch superfamily enzyme